MPIIFLFVFQTYVCRLLCELSQEWRGSADECWPLLSMLIAGVVCILITLMLTTVATAGINWEYWGKPLVKINASFEALVKLQVEYCV